MVCRMGTLKTLKGARDCDPAAGLFVLIPLLDSHALGRLARDGAGKAALAFWSALKRADLLVTLSVPVR